MVLHFPPGGPSGIVMRLAAAGPWRAHEGNSPGWRLLTPAERVEHQRRLRWRAWHHLLGAGVVLGLVQVERLLGDPGVL